MKCNFVLCMKSTAAQGSIDLARETALALRAEGWAMVYARP